MSDRDLEYFRRRERQERERAETADDSIARRVHLEMAERYSAMLGGGPVVMPLQQAS